MHFFLTIYQTNVAFYYLFQRDYHCAPKGIYQQAICRPIALRESNTRRSIERSALRRLIVESDASKVNQHPLPRRGSGVGLRGIPVYLFTDCVPHGHDIFTASHRGVTPITVRLTVVRSASVVLPRDCTTAIRRAAVTEAGPGGGIRHAYHRTCPARVRRARVLLRLANVQRRRARSLRSDRNGVASLTEAFLLVSDSLPPLSRACGRVDPRGWSFRYVGATSLLAKEIPTTAKESRDN